MTNALTVVRLGLVASLLGAALLIGSVRAGTAAEIAPIPVSASVPQAQDAGQAAPDATTSGHLMLPSVGAVGFGWG